MKPKIKGNLPTRRLTPALRRALHIRPVKRAAPGGSCYRVKVYDPEGHLISDQCVSTDCGQCVGSGSTRCKCVKPPPLPGPAI